MLIGLCSVLLLASAIAACAGPATSPARNSSMLQPGDTLGDAVLEIAETRRANRTSLPIVRRPSPTEQSQAEPTKKPKGGNVPIAPTSTSREFIAYEITGRPTTTSIAVNIVPAVDVRIYYEYGITSGAYTAQTTTPIAMAHTPLETLIENLKPNTRYYYRMHYNSMTGTERTFVTQRATGSTFTFDIQGDSHSHRTKNQFDPNLYTRTLFSAASDLPDF